VVRRRFRLTQNPFNTVYLPLNYSGNPGANDEPHGGVHGKRWW
jgi:hypothetical protein